MPSLYRQRPALRVAFLTLAVSMLVDKCWIAREYPQLSALVSVNPMPVFLDIPMDLSLNIDLVPVAGLFFLLYSTWGGLRPGFWTTLQALLAIPLWTLAAGLIYHVTQSQIPRHIQNAICSFGLNMDIYTMIPGHERIRLCGSMVMFAGFLIGAHKCLRLLNRKRVASHDPASPSLPSVMEPQAIEEQSRESPAFVINGMEN